MGLPIPLQAGLTALPMPFLPGQPPPFNTSLAAPAASSASAGGGGGGGADRASKPAPSHTASASNAVDRSHGMHHSSQRQRHPANDHQDCHANSTDQAHAERAGDTTSGHRANSHGRCSTQQEPSQHAAEGRAEMHRQNKHGRAYAGPAQGSPQHRQRATSSSNCGDVVDGSVGKRTSTGGQGSDLRVSFGTAGSSPCETGVCQHVQSIIMVRFLVAINVTIPWLFTVQLAGDSFFLWGVLQVQQLWPRSRWRRVVAAHMK